MKRWILSAALAASLLGAGTLAADAHCGWGPGCYRGYDRAAYADETCPCGYGDPHTRGDCPYYGGRYADRGGWYDDDGYYHRGPYRHHGCRY